jgi:hypothetical protein
MVVRYRCCVGKKLATGKSTLVPFYRLLPFGITGSNDFVQSEENTRVFRIPVSKKSAAGLYLSPSKNKYNGKKVCVQIFAPFSLN